MGFAPHGMAASRYFGRSQWQLPTAEHYARMHGDLGRVPAGEHLRAEYEHLRRYEHLRAEYEHLRPSTSTSGGRSTRQPALHMSTCGTATVADYPGKHPCSRCP